MNDIVTVLEKMAKIIASINAITKIMSGESE